MKKKEVLEEELQATQDDNTSSGPELIWVGDPCSTQSFAIQTKIELHLNWLYVQLLRMCSLLKKQYASREGHRHSKR